MGAKSTGTQMPLVVAMRGTNAEEGLQILADASLNVTTVGNLGEAAIALTQVLGANAGLNKAAGAASSNGETS
mgnify:FL=1